MKKDFVMVKDLDFQMQLNKFYAEIKLIGASLGLTPEEIEQAGKDAAAFSYVLTAQHSANEFVKTVTAFKNDIKSGIGGAPKEFPVFTIGADAINVPDGIVSRLRALAAKIKTSSNYTEAIGQQLGIIGVDVPDENPDTAKPLIGGLSIVASQVTLKWKKGSFDGIRVFKKVDGGEFNLTGFSISPPYTDRAPIPSSPQVWSYMIQYIVDDDEVGQLSEPFSITVSSNIASAS